MTQSKKPRILILEANESLASRAVDLLEDQGWEVVWEQVSAKALARLEESKASPFHLFISNFKLPKMEGDDILKNAKAISPLTQRMLMVEATQTEMVIRAINKAEINACITTPTTDQDLISQAQACLDQFDKAMKHEQLKRVTSHQNKQMFQIAQRLKKKDRICQEKISEKKAEKLSLRSKLRKAGTEKKKPLNLSDRLQLHGISLDPAGLGQEFAKLADYIQAILDSTATKAGLEKSIPEISQIIAPLPESPAGSPELDPEAALIRDGLIQELLDLGFSSPGNTDTPVQPNGQEETDETSVLKTACKITISQDQTQAFIKLTAPAPESLTLTSLLDLLLQREISFGIKDDSAIESWIENADPGEEKFLVAKGEMPVQGKDGEVSYLFEADYSNPGKIMEDGRIDFRDRGEIPYVNKGDLLATKVPPVEGKEGMSVAGVPILVEVVLDPVFMGGSGTKLSEDGLSIFAALDGQPHLDALGEVSVNPELTISGDVDFETGNIDFNGNILVMGTVKEGFSVKGISLTAKEIQGATIHLSGDLYISDGITDATISSVASIHAKFLNNSQVNGFGNLVIQKEIIDSQILISGACENSTGVILASQIIAKGGIEAGKIGTTASKPAKLKIGVDEHIERQTAEIETQLTASVSRLQEIRDKIKAVETLDQALYEQVTVKAQEQEAAQNQIKEAKKEASGLKKANDGPGLNQALVKIKALAQTAEKAEQDLNQIFETQDRYAKEIDQFKRMVTRIEEANKNLVLKKKGLREFSEKTPALPRLLVQGHITQDTTIQGPNTNIQLMEDRNRCQILEKDMEEDGLHFYEMEILDL